jgi:hypothetical protein
VCLNIAVVVVFVVVVISVVVHGCERNGVFFGGGMCRISFLKHIAQSLAKLGSAGVTCRKVPYQANSF